MFVLPVPAVRKRSVPLLILPVVTFIFGVGETQPLGENEGRKNRVGPSNIISQPSSKDFEDFRTLLAGLSLRKFSRGGKTKMFGKVEMSIGGFTIDVVPYAKMATVHLEKDERIGARALAKFFKKLDGRPAHSFENHFKLHHRRVNALMDRMCDWIRFDIRIKQACGRDDCTTNPHVLIVVNEAPCERTRAMDCKIMPAAEVPLLPFPECPLGRCEIRTYLLSEQDIAALTD